MKHILPVIAFLLFYSYSVVGQDSLVYSDNAKLSWENFKGIPNHSDTVVARIATIIQMKIEKISIWTGVTTFSAWSIMHPEKSWVREEYKDDYTLNHEQLHFDISEVVARRLEKYINQQRINGGDNKKATKIYNEFVMILKDLQAKYDNETAGGNNHDEQSKWDHIIRKELKETEKLSLTKAKNH